MIMVLREMRALVFAYGIVRLLQKVAHEDSALRTQHPIVYERYAHRVKRLVPWVW
jgi:protein-S-isoprenylcysteine O-methyltransferase Ste14